MSEPVPVICIDGPSGVGKGTISLLLARELGWHVLDSGSIYRVLAYEVAALGIDLQNEHALAQVALELDVSFQLNNQKLELLILLRGNDVSQQLRTEACAKVASKIAVFPLVRTALTDCQRRLRTPPGLVADGRDMGTVIFPDANTKLFLQASPEIRAERRFKQLREAGIDVSLSDLLREISERDERDRSRDTAPLQPAKDAVIIDTSELSIEQVYAEAKSVVNNNL